MPSMTNDETIMGIEGLKSVTIPARNPRMELVMLITILLTKTHQN
jgi:hypothetical protein